MVKRWRGGLSFGVTPMSSAVRSTKTAVRNPSHTRATRPRAQSPGAPARPSGSRRSQAPGRKPPEARSPLAQRLLQDLQLAGRGERTQEAYLRAVRQLAAYTKLSPERITEEQVRQYFLYQE